MSDPHDPHVTAPAPPELPRDDVADGRERKLDPRLIRVDRVTGAILAAVLAAALLCATVVVVVAGSWGWFAGLSAAGAWLVVSLALTGLLFWWPAVSYRHTFYRVTDSGIRIRRGVLWRTVSSVPRSRVQHTDVSQGPVERGFGLATLVIYTAGTHQASVSLPGLSRETALTIRDHLISGGEDDAV